MLVKDKAAFQNFEEAVQYEWLETNGLGGWSGSSLTGAHTRRYHGLLVAATVPPVNRMVLLSKLDETIVTDNKRIELSANLYEDGTVHPNGHLYISSFKKELFPQWCYEAEGFTLRKTVAMVHGENTTLIIYQVKKANQPFTLELLPLMAARGYHQLEHASPRMHWDVDFNDGIFHNKPDGEQDVFINIPGSSYTHTPRWFNYFKYSAEQYRGLDFTEDLFNHGTFAVTLHEGDTLGIIISTENPADKNALDLFEKEKERKIALLNDKEGDDTFEQLVLAADQFIVQRGEDLKTVIAGYHWFTDWGRDTMISLPGLCLSTGRYDDAKKILSAFAKSVSMGMLPNRFRDNNEAPEYNNADGTLWYFIAVYKYLEVTNDRSFVLNEILPVLKNIIEWHYKGTRYNIHATPDGLLYAGEQGQQLTWMDARIGDWVVTPRMGRPIEIQALWYNALYIFSELLSLNKEENANEYLSRASGTKETVNKLFWHNEGGYLFDNINENNQPDATLRPNQLFAISLPWSLIDDKEKAQSILNVIESQLYTPIGLRSLPQDHPNYIPHYGGNQWHRDAAYHQGTVWSWLLGAYIDAIIRFDSINGKQKAREVIHLFRYHMNEGCIGSVSEIFDGDAPQHPGGCVAQAWSVAEILRVIQQYQLYEIETEVVEEEYHYSDR